MSFIKSIASCPLFLGLAEDEVGVFRPAFELISVPEGQNIISEGEPGTAIEILVKGTVSISKALTLQPADATNDTRDKALITLTGDAKPFFGEMGLVRENVNRTATVKAETDCEIVEVERDKFLEILKQYPHVGFQVMYNVANKLARDLQRESQNVLKLTTAFSLILDE
ncbi:MAG: cyclic nucleotide-binding domain-containing protein [Lentisphaeria bacterium]|nr:cyclic nucleotide-binding domain-containing protein [Candidatus Neomarinimicrobiota bacterium]MCF7843188.1 cyclic nucleotide-binding domain-containing protein [Lentisphaeria bacterium]